ncbi:hemagglutinin/hemolysin-like protein, partial [Candidatus Magnetomorum sp. HK-1]
CSLTLTDLIIDDPDEQSFDAYTLIVHPGNTYEYQYTKIIPKPNFYGSITVPVHIMDNTLKSNSFDLNITIKPVDDPPKVNDFHKNGREDIPIDFTAMDFSNGFSDLENDPVDEIKIMSLPEKGTLMLANTPVAINQTFKAESAAKLQFMPDFNTVGIHSFYWTASDGFRFAENLATVTLTILADPIGISTILKTGPEDQDIQFDHSDLAHFNLNTTSFIQAVSVPEFGELLFDSKKTSHDHPFSGLLVKKGDQWAITVLTAGELIYRPEPDFTGTVSFLWRASKHDVWSENEQVKITLTPVNDPPVMTGFAIQTSEDTAYSFENNFFYQHFKDVDQDILSHVMIQDAPEMGSLALGDIYQTKGMIIASQDISSLYYIPYSNVYGSDIIRIQAYDGTVYSNAINISVSIRPVNDIPVIAGQQQIQTLEDTSIDLSTDMLEIIDPDAEQKFLLFIHPGNHYEHLGMTIVPTPNVNGLLHVPVSVSDSIATSDIFDLAIRVMPENDPPLITGQHIIATSEETPLSIPFSALQVEDPDNIFPQDFSIQLSDGVNYTYSERIVYPATDFTGNLLIPVRVNDGQYDSQWFHLNLSVTPVNDIPIITGQHSISMDQRTSIEILVNHLHIKDPDSNTFLLSVTDNPQYERIGNTIIPSPDFVGHLSVPIFVSDGSDNSLIFNLIVTVHAVNIPPKITGQKDINILEDRGCELILDHFTIVDEDSDQFQITVLDGNNYQHIHQTIIPESDFFGTLTIPVYMNDGIDNSPVFNARINVHPVNDRPNVTNTISLTVSEESPITLSLDHLTIKDPDNEPEDFRIIINAGQNYTFENLTIFPSVDFNGQLPVCIQVSDGTDTSADYYMMIDITPVNDPPEIIGQSDLSVYEEQPLTLTVSALDIYDPDNIYPDNFSLIIHDGQSYIHQRNQVIPKKNVTGMVQVNVSVTDGQNESAVRSINVNVINVNDPPVIQNIDFQGHENMPLYFKAADFSNAYTDIDDDPLYQVQITQLPDQGKLILNDKEVLLTDSIPVSEISQLYYMPEQGWSGSTQFSWKAMDYLALSVESAICQFIIVEDPLMTTTIMKQGNEDQDIEFSQEDIANLSLNTTSQIQSVSLPENGELLFDANEDNDLQTFNGSPVLKNQVFSVTDLLKGELIYRPESNFNGSDAFQWKISKNNIWYEDYVKITVIPQNDVPEIISFEKQTNEDNPISFSAKDFSNNFNDIDQDALNNITITALPRNGQLNLNGIPITINTEIYAHQLNQLSYVPSDDIFGKDTFSWTASDGMIDTPYFKSVNITIQPINDIPVITGQKAISIYEDHSFVLLQDHLICVDPDDQSFQLSILNGLNYSYEDNTIYPMKDFNGMLFVNVSVADSLNESDSWQLSIQVLPVNDPPVIIRQYTGVSIEEDHSYTLTINQIEVIDPDSSLLELNISDGYHFTFAGNIIHPQLDFYGDLEIPIKISDGMSTSDLFMFRITVLPHNDPPIIAGQKKLFINEDTSVSLSLSDLIIHDPDNQYPEDFTLLIAKGSHYQFKENMIIPNNNFSGVLYVPVQVSDQLAESDPFILSIQVIAVNDKPLISGQKSLVMTEDSSLALSCSDLIIEDPDTSIDSMQLIIHDGVRYQHADQKIIPESNYFGILKVVVSVNDSMVNSATYDISITVLPINDPPTIISQKDCHVFEEQAFDILPDLFVVDDPDNTFPGEFTITVNNGYHYTALSQNIIPYKDYNGMLSVPVQISDGQADSPVFMMNLSVLPVNDPPFISGQKEIQTYEDTSVTINIDNFIIKDPDNTQDDFTLIIHDGKHYDHTENTVMPANNFYGQLMIPVQLGDGADISPIFMFIINVLAVNDLPMIVEHRKGHTLEEMPYDIKWSDISVVDPDNAYSDNFTLIIKDDPNYSISGNRISPASDFNGLLTVNIRVSDGTLKSPWYPFTIDVEPVNDPPIIIGQNYLETPEEIALTIKLTDLLVVDTDNTFPDDFTLNISDVFSTSVSITPEKDFSGTLKIPVIVNDSVDTSNPYLLDIIVSPINDAPVIKAQQQLITKEDLPITLTVDDFTIVDPDSKILDMELIIADGDNYTHFGETILPVNDYTGQLKVSVFINDATDMSTQFDTIITVQATNDPPQIYGQREIMIHEDNSYTLTTDDTLIKDIDNDPEDFTLFVYPGENYTIIDMQIIPRQNFCGILQVKTTVNDGTADSSPYFLTIDVLPVNDLPIIVNSTVYGHENVLLYFDPSDFSKAYTDVEHHLLSGIQIATEPGSGQLFNAGQKVFAGDILQMADLDLQYSPAVNISGLFDFHWKAFDGQGWTDQSAAMSLSITANPVHIESIVKTGFEDQDIDFDASDLSGFSLNDTSELMAVTIPSHGLLLFDPQSSNPDHAFFNGQPVQAGQIWAITKLLSGELRFRPETDFNGLTYFLWKASKNSQWSDPEQVNISIIPVNDPPIIQQVLLQENEDTALKFQADSFIIVFSDADDDVLASITILSVPDHGNLWMNQTEISQGISLSVTAIKSLFYVPELNFYGKDSFYWSASDGSANSLSSVVSLEILSVNDPPIVTSQQFIGMSEDTSRTIQFSDINIADPDDTYPQDFTLTVLPGDAYSCEGNIISPKKDLFGTIDVALRIMDSKNASTTYALSVHITPINDSPIIATQKIIQIREDQAYTVTVEDFTIIDPDNDKEDLNIHLFNSNHYSVYGNRILPELNYFGILSVPLIVNDGALESLPYTLDISVAPVNDPPEITGQLSVSVLEEHTLPISIDQLVVNDPDNKFPGDFNLVVKDGGNYQRSGNNIRPLDNFNGTLTVPVIVYDRQTNSSVFHMSVTVLPVNDTPIITGHQSLTAFEETPFDIGLTHLQVSDPDNVFDDFILQVMNGAYYTHSQQTILPAANFNGIINVNIQVFDGTDFSSVYSIPVSVKQINDQPMITGHDDIFTTEDTVIQLSLDMLTIVDPDGTIPDLMTLKLYSGDHYTLKNTTIIPDPDFSGILYISMKVNDGSIDSDLYTLPITVQAVNDPPNIIGYNPIEIAEDSSRQISINDISISDPDTPLAELKIFVQAGEHYKVDGSNILPDQNYSGYINVPCFVRDTTDQSNTILLNIRIIEVNDSPVFSGFSKEGHENTRLYFGSTDFAPTYTDIESHSMDHIKIQSLPDIQTGWLFVNQRRIQLDDCIDTSELSSFYFVPYTDWCQTNSFQVYVNDGNAYSAQPGSIYIHILADPINIGTVTKIGFEDKDVPFDSSDLSNFTLNSSSQFRLASIPEHGQLLFDPVKTTPSQPFNGTPVSIDDIYSIEKLTGGELLFRPKPNFNGFTSFSWKASKNDQWAEDLIKITIQAVNDLPVIDSITKNGPEDSQLLLRASDFTEAFLDIDHDHLSDILIQSGPENGRMFVGTEAIKAPVSVSMSKLDDLSYVPDTNFFGVDHILWNAFDGQAFAQESSFITFTIAPINDPPVIVSQKTMIINEDEYYALSFTDFTVVDPDSDYPTAFTLTINNGNNYMVNGFKITPKADYYGELIIPVFISDGVDESPIFDIKLTVLPINDRPVISAIDDITIIEDIIAGPLTFIISDIETLAAQLRITTEIANPEIISSNNIHIEGITDNRRLTLTPLTHKTGSTYITITVADDVGLAASESFMLSIVAVADPPILDVQPIASTFENMPLSLTIHPPKLIDLDGSESLSLITLSGIPQDMTLSSGVYSEFGSWTLSIDQLRDLFLMPSQGYVGSFSLTVQVSAIESSNLNQADTQQKISAYFHEAQNNHIPTDISATWDSDRIHLNWSISDDIFATQIYRGTVMSDLEKTVQTQALAYTDTSVLYYQDYYYQFVSLKECIDPITKQKIYITGPLSEILYVSGQQAPILNLTDVTLQPDGTYIKRASSTSACTISGTYDSFSGTPFITASSENKTITGSIYHETFSILLPTPGLWKITGQGSNPWESISVNVNVQTASMPGELLVETDDEQSVKYDTISIYGSIGHTQFESFSVKVLSDRFPGQSFDIAINPTGSFAGDIPLSFGDNQLTVISTDASGYTSEKNIHVFRDLPEFPEIEILFPKNGAIVSEQFIDLTGTVCSQILPENIRIRLNDLLAFPEGTKGQYTFVFQHVELQEGFQTLSVLAETANSKITEDILVGYNVNRSQESKNYPKIEIFSPKQIDYIKGEQLEVRGLIYSESGVASVMVNEKFVKTTGLNSQVSFHTSVECIKKTAIVILATDVNGLTSSVQCLVYQDLTVPVITVSDLKIAPEINIVKQTPYLLNGMVTDAYLAGLSMNDEEMLFLTPGDQDDTWLFNTKISLAPQEAIQIKLEAWDRSGNRSYKVIVLQLDNNISIEILSPQNEQNFTVTESSYDLPLNIRALGMNAGDTVQVVIDSNSSITLERDDTTATGNIALTPSTDSHELVAMIIDENKTVKMTKSTNFWVRHYDDLPLSILKIEPENGASGVAPNASIDISFNRSVDPLKLTATVLQTVHGMAYSLSEKGTGLSQLSNISLEEIHKDRESLEIDLSYFPEKKMLSIHTKEDTTYGAQIYLSLRYDDTEILSSDFNIRPLPTFIQGNVSDQQMNALKGITVDLSTMNRTTETDENGIYAFGFGDSADQSIPPGRYKITINPGLKNASYGTTSLWINVQEGCLNYTSKGILPYLNQHQPYVPVISGQVASLNDGNLILDLRSADVIFPDDRKSGLVHVQFIEYGQFQYQVTQSVSPNWMYTLHPSDIAVLGNVQLTIKAPMLQDSYEYLSSIGQYVVLIGLDPDTLTLKAVGVGKVNLEEHTIDSTGKVYLKQLDYLGYALVGDNHSKDFEMYIQNQLTIEELMGRLGE